MAQPCTVLIAAPELLEALKSRVATADAELIAFTNTEALRALQVITNRRPHIVGLERLFAATPRGAALINRIKADPSLTGCEIRVVSLEPEEPRATPAPPVAPSPPLPADAEAPLDAVGTRRTPRFAVSDIEVLIDGNPASIVNLSIGGVQVLSPTVLKPNQRVRVSLSDQGGILRVSGSVAWATFEIPPRYRAGIEFLEADAAALEGLVQRHRS